jgi:repressor of nif and glnA expression
MDNPSAEKRLLIMKLLRESREPLSSAVIEEKLLERGIGMSERTVRFHLQALDAAGLTVYREKKGRFLTPAGLQELERARVFDRVGFLSARIDEMIYRMDYNFTTGLGRVLVNVSLVRTDKLPEAVPLLKEALASGLCMGDMLTLFREGDELEEFLIPTGFTGIGTVCSITLNGILLSAGIPVSSIFGGLLEIRAGEPERFTAIIKYDGTTLDPLEIFIRGGMTDTTGAARQGNGFIGASFREVPASSIEKVLELDLSLKRAGLGGFLKIGYPGQSLLEIPMEDRRAGVIVAGGLNAVAVLSEAGIDVRSRALSGLVDIGRFFHWRELNDRIRLTDHRPS